MGHSGADSHLFQSPEAQNQPDSLDFSKVGRQIKENRGKIALAEVGFGRFSQRKDEKCGYFLGEVQASDASEAGDQAVAPAEEADDVWLAAYSLNP